MAPSDSPTQLKLIPTHSDHTFTIPAALVKGNNPLIFDYAISDSLTSFSASFPLITDRGSFISTSSTRIPFVGEQAGTGAEISVRWTMSSVRPPLTGNEWIANATEALERLALDGGMHEDWTPIVGRVRARRVVDKVPKIRPVKQGYHLLVR